MKNKSSTHSAFFSLRALLGFALCIVGAMLAFFAFGGSTGVAGLASAKRTNRSEANVSKLIDRLGEEDGSRFPGASSYRKRAQQGADIADPSDERASGPASISAPMEGRGAKSGRSFDGDLRSLPFVQEPLKERPEREAPFVSPRPYPGSESAAQNAQNSTNLLSTLAPSLNAPAPAPLATFDGLDYPTWGNGHPPDTNGDVGPNHYIQTTNTSIGIYNKTTGAPIARFTFNTFMSQGNFGNLCDTDNFGDPVVLYDTFEDRWIITDFAFQLDGLN